MKAEHDVGDNPTHARGGLEYLNPTCQWQVGQFRLDGIASIRFATGKSAPSPLSRTVGVVRGYRGRVPHTEGVQRGIRKGS